MERRDLRQLLNKLKKGNISVDEMMEKLKSLPFADLEFAKIDTHRNLRRGFPEVIYCPGKTVEDIVRIAREIIESGSNLLATHAAPKIHTALRKKWLRVTYEKRAQIVYYQQHEPARKKGLILVITGGTSDIPVAEEAAITLELMGNPTERLYDVGVAGIHRLLRFRDKIEEAKAIIVIAGMEGALASVVAGMVDKPVIAVPTSVGYGAHFQGIAPLLTMLNSCAGGVAVMNIDNGYGAAYFANLINS